MVRVGLVGIGFMGMIHFLASKKVRGARVTAICSRDPKKLSGDWRGIQGNFGPKGDQMELKGVKGYADFQEMIEDPEIDMVDICSPTDQHAPMAIAALKAGKHVLVEKAIALSAGQADKMIDAAEKGIDKTSESTSSYGQNEEQAVSGKWKNVSSVITEKDYIEATERNIKDMISRVKNGILPFYRVPDELKDRVKEGLANGRKDNSDNTP